MTAVENEPSTLERVPDDGVEALSSTHAAYLLVFDRESSWIVPLGPNGEYRVGRTDSCQVQLRDKMVSRVHAAVRIEAGAAALEDLASHNGTELNGRTLTAPCPLLSGDVIGIGDVRIVYHSRARSDATPQALPLAAFRQRLAEELERARGYSRSLVLALIAIGENASDDRKASLLSELRSIDPRCWLDRQHLLVALPECSLDEAREVLGSVGTASVGSALRARAGIAAYPEHGADFEALLAAARHAVERAAPGSTGAFGQTLERQLIGPHEVVIADPSTANLYALLRRLAASTLPVLIQGETGSGKELAASALHHWSARSRGPFVSVNCAAIVEGLAESELFGHRRGAFSGAVADKAGLAEAASGGTLFLDEVGELALPIQAKLLRALESQCITRLGETAERRIDVRIVAATHRDLLRGLREGTFREDLFFRLSAATVWIPPLRDRAREIRPLFESFVARACERSTAATPNFSAAAWEQLVHHDWPGNVRQLANAAEYFVAIGAALVTADDVRAYLERVSFLRNGTATASTRMTAAPKGSGAATAPAARHFRRIDDEIRELERQRMNEALLTTCGNRTRAAELIGMPLRTFVTKLKLYGLGRQHANDPQSSKVAGAAQVETARDEPGLEPKSTSS